MDLIIFDKENKNAIGRIPNAESFDKVVELYPDEIKNSMGYIYSDKSPDNIREYFVIGENFVKMDEQELLEIERYNRILSPDERLIESLKPSMAEVQKAESEIEILTLLNEVGAIWQ